MCVVTSLPPQVLSIPKEDNSAYRVITWVLLWNVDSKSCVKFLREKWSEVKPDPFPRASRRWENLEESRLWEGGLKEWAEGNRKKGGKGKEPPAERSEVSADSMKGNTGGEEHCPKRISANFLWAWKLQHCLSKKIYVKTHITFQDF